MKLEEGNVVRVIVKLGYEKDGGIREWRFDYTAGPKEEIGVSSYLTPHEAPFREAFYDGFLPVLLKVIFELKGKDIKPIIRALVDKDIFSHNAVVKALDNINPKWRETEDAKREIPDLINALKDKDPETRRIAVWALGEIKNRQAIEPLISTLKDKDVCYESVEALKKITSEDFKADYNKWNNWWKGNKGKSKQE